jgi:hypothetical protein
MKNKSNKRILAEYLAKHNLISAKYIKFFTRQKHDKSTGAFSSMIVEWARTSNFLAVQELFRELQDIENNKNNKK